MSTGGDAGATNPSVRTRRSSMTAKIAARQRPGSRHMPRNTRGTTKLSSNDVTVPLATASARMAGPASAAIHKEGQFAPARASLARGRCRCLVNSSRSRRHGPNCGCLARFAAMQIGIVDRCFARNSPRYRTLGARRDRGVTFSCSIALNTIRIEWPHVPDCLHRTEHQKPFHDSDGLPL
jgi:hypothetical protein